MRPTASKHCDEWNELDFFDSQRDYERFQEWVKEKIDAGRVREIGIARGAGWGNAWDEHWYQCVACRQRWRLVGPDPPFRGVFKKVRRKGLFAGALDRFF